MTQALLPIEIDSRDLRQAFGCFATGVAIVSTRTPEGQPVGMTVNSLASVSMSPPALSWCLRNESPNYDNFVRASYFGVSVLAHDQEALCRRFATPQADKFADVAVKAGESGVPLIASAVAAFECERIEAIACGDHAILIGTVARYAWRRQCAPLLFFQGALHAAELRPLA